MFHHRRYIVACRSKKKMTTFETLTVVSDLLLLIGRRNYKLVKSLNRSNKT